MNNRTIIIALFGLVFGLVPAAAVPIDNALQKWPSDIRADLSDEQVRIGMTLANRDLHGITDDDRCQKNAEFGDNVCFIGKYGFRQNTLKDITIFLASERSPDVLSTVMSTQYGLLFTFANLSAQQTRAISIDFAQTILGRDLNTIDPENRDTLFDQKNMNFDYLEGRLASKLIFAANDKACDSKISGEVADHCKIGPFAVQDTGGFSFAVSSINMPDTPLFWMHSGSIVVDATKATNESVDMVLDVMEAALSVHKGDVRDVPSYDVTRLHLERVVSAALTKEACSPYEGFPEGSNSQDDKPCQFGEAFISESKTGKRSLQAKYDEHSWGPFLWIEQEKPFVRVSATEDDQKLMESLSAYMDEIGLKSSHLP